ncbi:MAG: type II toxin-antitoxin system VapC family toxin [Gammaproteobacteria bacterium]|nr:type II toxin-antitoxin system VapC family toxin [Gammaproteobacteria bacterium]
MYLLDTNVIGEIARNPQGGVANRVAALPPDEYGINPIVACEIGYGLTKRESTRLRRQIEAILEAIAVIELPSDIATHYGRIRAELEKQGTPIDPNDLLIAAHGLASELTLVTGNEKEFRRVRELNVENWLTR